MTIYIIYKAYHGDIKTYEYMPYDLKGSIMAFGFKWFIKNNKQWYFSEKRCKRVTFILNRNVKKRFRRRRQLL